MNYAQIIEEVKEFYPSEYETGELIRFLAEAESGISMYIENKPTEITDLTKEAILPLPFSGMYAEYIKAQIALNQHDDETYQRYIGMYNARFNEFKRWYIRSHPGKTVKYNNWL